MKSHFVAALATALLFSVSNIPAAQTSYGAFIYETPREYFGAGDFNGDGRTDVVITDKETGKFRVGYQSTSGTVTWIDNRSSGIKPISGFGIGPVLATNLDGFVFSSADANQLSIGEASNPGEAGRPVTIMFTAGLGPSAVVPIDIGGDGNTPLADLYVASIYNSPDANLATTLRNDGAEFPVVAEGAVLPGVPSHANKLRPKAGGAELACILFTTGQGDELRLEELGSGKPSTAAQLTGLPDGSGYTIGTFSGGGRLDFLVYKPGANTVQFRPLQETGGKYTFGAGTSYDLGAPVLRVMTLATSGAQTLFVIFGEGEKAGVFNFDGKQAPALAQTIYGTNDLFTGAAVVGNSLVAFLQSPGGKFSSRYQLYSGSPGQYTLNAFGSLPSLADNDNITIPDIQKRIVSKAAVKEESEMKLYTNTIPGTRVSYIMVPIKGGEFVMGTKESEPNRKPDEGPQHKVKISPFWMGRCEVTWNEYELFMYPDEEKRTRASVPTDEDGDKLADAVTHPSKPYVEMSFGMGKDGFPAISMTQHAANKYCQWLSAKTGEFYRLPTEAEWEYACRAGTTTAYFFGDDPAQLKDYGWYEMNSDFKYQKVGKKKPNPWGLYDMTGNVVEWVLDQYDAEFYSACAKAPVTTDPWNKATKPYPHAVRGGSWDDQDFMLRSGARRGSDRTWKMQDPQLPKSIWYFSDAQFVGFRVVRPLKVPSAGEMQKYWSNGVERD